MYWLRPDLAVHDLGSVQGDCATRARRLLAAHGIGPLGESVFG